MQVIEQNGKFFSVGAWTVLDPAVVEDRIVTSCIHIVWFELHQALGVYRLCLDEDCLWGVSRDQLSPDSFSKYVRAPVINSQ